MIASLTANHSEGPLKFPNDFYLDFLFFTDIGTSKPEQEWSCEESYTQNIGYFACFY